MKKVIANRLIQLENIDSLNWTCRSVHGGRYVYTSILWINHTMIFQIQFNFSSSRTTNRHTFHDNISPHNNTQILNSESRAIGNFDLFLVRHSVIMLLKMILMIMMMEKANINNNSSSSWSFSLVGQKAVSTLSFVIYLKFEAIIIMNMGFALDISSYVTFNSIIQRKTWVFLSCCCGQN